MAENMVVWRVGPAIVRPFNHYMSVDGPEDSR
jgi:hypothetical protein